ncbi:unnamed protein product [Nesidiocoris tenuis]|uniref:Uncharacterized protein n=2 Tax=Nesidiocoris tenuis TaxID=355587 RepID=A0A6H5G8R9_9HEMI|nr:7 transmembrane receptor (rhodopsin family) [Nesidiocoris tenuis]CAA9998644.1 unnamed protein product [Nesidiocoris tenuis]
MSFTKYGMTEYFDGSIVPACLTELNSWIVTSFFIFIICLFVIIPLLILIFLYSVIAKHLMADSAASSTDGFNQRARKQVVLMLVTVVVSFFTCLLPFRIFTLWIIITDRDTIHNIGIDAYYSLLYLCRIMLYLNSAINPILYNLMSSKFRHGFSRMVMLRRKRNLLLLRHRATFNSSLTHSSTRGARGSPDLSWRGASLDSRRNGSIRRSVIIRSSLLGERKTEDSLVQQNPESYV